MPYYECRWEEAFEAFTRSNKSCAAFHREDLLAFCPDGRLPSLPYVYGRFRELRVQFAEVPCQGDEPAHDAVAETVKPEPGDALVRVADLTRRPTFLPRREAPEAAQPQSSNKPRPVKLTLPGGVLMEFPCDMPELLAANLVRAALEASP